MKFWHPIDKFYFPSVAFFGFGLEAALLGHWFLTVLFWIAGGIFYSLMLQKIG